MYIHYSTVRFWCSLFWGESSHSTPYSRSCSGDVTGEHDRYHVESRLSILFELDSATLQSVQTYRQTNTLQCSMTSRFTVQYKSAMLIGLGSFSRSWRPAARKTDRCQNPGRETQKATEEAAVRAGRRYWGGGEELSASRGLESNVKAGWGAQLQGRLGNVEESLLHHHLS